MRGVLADTGPLYAAYDSSDRFHTRAQQELLVLSQQALPVVVIYPVLLECQSLLMKRLGPIVGRRFLEDMRVGTLWVEPKPRDYDGGIQRLQKYPDQAITLCDGTIAAVAQRLGLPIWTYDFHFDVMFSQVWR